MHANAYKYIHNANEKTDLVKEEIRIGTAALEVIEKCENCKDKLLSVLGVKR